MKNLEKVFDFLKIAGRLKTTFRYTNLNSDDRRESTADHSWRLAMMVFVVSRELSLDLDVDRAIKIALTHDLAESLTGDIDAVLIARGEVSPNEKKEAELKAIQEIKNTLPTEVGEEIFGIWSEYEDYNTPEGKFVKALDKLETITQLVELGYGVYDAPEFIPTYADKYVEEFPPLIPLLKMLKQRLREEYKKGGFEWKVEYNKFL